MELIYHILPVMTIQAEQSMQTSVLRTGVNQSIAWKHNILSIAMEEKAAKNASLLE